MFKNVYTKATMILIALSSISIQAYASTSADASYDTLTMLVFGIFAMIFVALFFSPADNGPRTDP
jgi:RsiW-degrading membrane proteinase PrsW (M82 family)